LAIACCSSRSRFTGTPLRPLGGGGWVSTRAMIARLYSTPSSVLDVTRNFIVLATSHSAVLLVLLAFYR